MSYVIVDDFCQYLDDVKESAFRAGFDTWNPNKGEVGSSRYEGMGMWGDHALMLRSLLLSTGRVLVPNSMFFRVTNKGMEKAYIHSDRESGDHTCVCYMTDHAEPYGTAFYKHIPTGLTEMPTFLEMKEMGILEELKKDMVDRSEDKWELVDYVEGKKNRAIIFDAPMFHSRYPLEGIGSSTEDGRLVWVSHFYHIDKDGGLY